MASSKSNRRLSIGGIVASILVGITALLASIGGFTHVIEESNYKSANGTITSLDLKLNQTYKKNTRNRCAPIVEFQANGQSYTSGPDQYSTYARDDQCEYTVGQKMAVHYNPADPSQSTVSNSTFDWTMGVFGIGLALVFGLVIPIRIIRRSRAASHKDA